MNVIRALVAVIGAVLRAATESFLMLASMLATALVVLAVVGVAAFGLSGMVGLRLGRGRRLRLRRRPWRRWRGSGR